MVATMTPDEREFVVFPRGVVRDDIILSYWRNALRVLVNPDTGTVFTEDEIARATQPGSRFYIEADSIDQYGQAMQARALFFAEQIRPNRSNTEFLEGFHGALWLGENSRLPATGGSGDVNAPATPGSIFVGSLTVPDPLDNAAVATDPNGLRYQVLSTVVAPAGGVAALQMKGIDTGETSNLLEDTVLTWSKNEPPGAEPEAVVTSAPAFSGGFDIETDDELGERIEERIRQRPASGNSAHLVAWSRSASVAVESAFIYPVAFYAGSVLVCVVQKRGSSIGPEARTSVAAGTLADVVTYLVPPNSAVFPQRAYVVVVAPNAQSSNLVLRISMASGSAGGWFDTTPWPAYSSSYEEVAIKGVTSQTEFTVDTDTDPPGSSPLTGTSVPALMLWDEDTSRWERLSVDEVSWAGVTKTIKLTTAPSFTIAVGDRLSPYTDRLGIIAEALESYFDDIGPGQVVDLDTDPRAGRAWRYPRPGGQYPLRAGQAVLTRLIDALGGASADAELTMISRSEPDLPGDIIDGPNQLVLGHATVFAL